MKLFTNALKATLLAFALTFTGSAYAGSFYTTSGIGEKGSGESFGPDNYTAQSVIFEVNFDYNTAATSADKPLLWEVGGNTIGAALWLDGANISFDVNGTIFTDVHGLSVTDPVSSVQVVAVLDFENDFQELYVNGLSLGTVASTSNDWAGGNASALGRQGGSQTGGGSGNSTEYPLGAGEEISFAVYLLSENTVGSILVPEPSSMMLIGFGGVLALLRRRR